MLPDLTSLSIYDAASIASPPMPNRSTQTEPAHRHQSWLQSQSIVRCPSPPKSNQIPTPAGGSRNENEVDDVDWAAHGADNDSDTISVIDGGTEDQHASEISHSEHASAADDQSDGDNQGQHIRAAAAQLKMAWNKRCACGMRL
jgi:hypothetical protein